MSMPHGISPLSLLDKFGTPFMAIAAACIAIGVFKSDVEHLKVQQDQQAVVQQVDHDKIVELRVNQQNMQQDVSDIKDKVTKLADRK